MQTLTRLPVPLTIIGGFLGSGKTSLLNHVLSKSSGMRIAVLVNDFGAINIDAKLIVSIEGETVSLANGCICCTIREDLLTEVMKLLESDEPPEHIVIETSGVSKPVAVVETFMNPAVQSLVDIQNLIAVLDADLVVDENAGYGNLAFDQITVSDLVVINKTDLVPPRRVADLKLQVAALVPRARIWETTFGEVPLDLIFNDRASAALAGPRPADAPGHGENGHHDHDHHDHGNQDQGHDVAFEAWSYRSDRAWSFAALQRAVDRLPGGIYRAKGTVRLDLPTGDHGILQMTGRRAWLRLCEPGADDPGTIATELVFIGTPGTTSNEDIGALFEQALIDASHPESDGYIVSDLRSFNVVFA